VLALTKKPETEYTPNKTCGLQHNFVTLLALNRILKHMIFQLISMLNSYYIQIPTMFSYAGSITWWTLEQQPDYTYLFEMENKVNNLK
jgi:hypothetical protein